jgi:hypothetical protein
VPGAVLALALALTPAVPAGVPVLVALAGLALYGREEGRA